MRELSCLPARQRVDYPLLVAPDFYVRIPHCGEPAPTYDVRSEDRRQRFVDKINADMLRGEYIDPRDGKVVATG